MNENILKNLSWNTSIKEQNIAINEIASMNNINLNELLQPMDKEYWENAAKVLSIIGYPRIEVVIQGLFRWLQDLNWPGAMIVMDLIKTIPRNVVIPYIESSAIEALNTNDEVWLCNMSTFIKYFKIKEDDFVLKNVFNTLLTVE